MAEAVLVVIKARVTALVAHLDAVLAKHYAEQKYRHSEPPTYCADYISAKWCRVSRIDIGSQSVVAFVCLADFSNKQLGAVKAGDIHKPASWERPRSTPAERCWRRTSGTASMRAATFTTFGEEILSMKHQLNVNTWKLLRALVREPVLTGKQLRWYHYSRITKDGTFLDAHVAARLIEVVTRAEPIAPKYAGQVVQPVQFRNTYRLTALGREAAEYGEYQPK